MEQNVNNSVWPIQKPLDPDFKTKLPDLQFYTLPNGLRVLLFPDSKDRGSKIRVLVNAGAIKQDTSLRGLAHFVEHMVFQGTQKFASNREMTEFAKDFNLENNAFTSNNRQEFYIDSDNDNESLDAAFDLLSQITLHATMPEAKASKEMEVILSERAMYQNEPGEVAYEVLMNHIYGGQHALGGGGILGTEEDIKAFTAQAAKEFYAKHFTPANMLLVMAGGAEAETYKQLAIKYFSHNSIESGWQVNQYINQSRLTESGNVTKDTKFVTTNSYFSLYFSELDVPFASKEYYALQIASDVIGTRIFLDLRDEQGLAYAVGAGLHDTDHGFLFFTFGEFEPAKYATAKPQMLDYLTKLVTNPISQKEFNRAVRKYKSTRWAGNARRIVSSVAEWLLEHGQMVSPEAFTQDYDALTLDTVQADLNKLLTSVKPEVIEVLAGQA